MLDAKRQRTAHSRKLRLVYIMIDVILFKIKKINVVVGTQEFAVETIILLKEITR